MRIALTSGPLFVELLTVANDSLSRELRKTFEDVKPHIFPFSDFATVVTDEK